VWSWSKLSKLVNSQSRSAASSTVTSGILEMLHAAHPHTFNPADHLTPAHDRHLTAGFLETGSAHRRPAAAGRPPVRAWVGWVEGTGTRTVVTVVLRAVDVPVASRLEYWHDVVGECSARSMVGLAHRVRGVGFAWTPPARCTFPVTGSVA
jgi:hypothetical protein